jgi:hypothetical protein
MSFTVNHPGGTNDAEFQAYARLLRQQGVNLGQAPRVWGPTGERRWLYVWDSRDRAQAFADELKEQTDDPAWRVVEVNSPPSEGPLGPIVIQLVRQADGLTFALHPLSRALIRSAFPQALSPTTYATIDTRAWYDYEKAKGGLAALVREIAPNLTGLDQEQLTGLGYSVVDADSNKTLFSQPPAGG